MSVHVALNHEWLAQAIRGAADLKLIGEAGELPEGLRLVEAMQPDVLLVDIGLPSGSGMG